MTVSEIEQSMMIVVESDIEWMKERITDAFFPQPGNIAPHVYSHPDSESKAREMFPDLIWEPMRFIPTDYVCTTDQGPNAPAVLGLRTMQEPNALPTSNDPSSYRKKHRSRNRRRRK